MGSLSLYQRYQRYRQEHGPGPAIPVLNEAILERGAAALAARLNSTRQTGRKQGDDIRKVASRVHPHFGAADQLRKVAEHQHNGRQVELRFEEHARQRELGRQQAEHQKLGDQLKATLQALQALNRAVGNRQ